jgi:hypothetical protein
VGGGGDFQPNLYHQSYTLLYKYLFLYNANVKMWWLSCKGMWWLSSWDVVAELSKVTRRQTATQQFRVRSRLPMGGGRNNDCVCLAKAQDVRRPFLIKKKY